MRARKHQPVRIAFATGAWLPIFAGMTLAARADESQSEQAAFDQYFRLPTASQSGNWSSHLSLGAAVGLNISAKFNESGMFNLPGSGLANGVYDDGYVHLDNSGDTQYTSNWGYQNALQLQNTPTGQQVVMHNTTSYQTANSTSQVNGGPFPGFDLDYGGSLHQWQNFRIGWDLGFDLMPMSFTDQATMTATVNQSAYTFNVPANLIVPGAPPYQGSASGNGPLLSAGASSATNSVTTGSVSGTRSLNAILYGLRLGPTLYWDISRNWSVSLGAGPAMGIVSGEYKYNEVVTTGNSSAPSSGSFNRLDVVYGGDINATLFYHTSDSARAVDLYLSAQFMSLGSANFNQGGRNASLDLSGQVYISAGVNWPF
jgi:hypothetical protein